ncbi:hypothetical protein EJ07DRAFT_151524 [Lizonia empirigonia]|nr:hypothetical protein EJ07DRAFT_151524 [Lizonia empirigonia]
MYHQGPNGTVTDSFHSSVQMHGAGKRHRTSLSSEGGTRTEDLAQKETAAKIWPTNELGAADTISRGPFRTPPQGVSSSYPAPTFERYQEQAQPFDALRYQSLGAIYQQQLQNQDQHHAPPSHGHYITQYAQNLQTSQADDKTRVPNAVLNFADGNDAFTGTTNLDSESWKRNFVAMLQTHQEYHGRSDALTTLPTTNSVGNFQAPPGLSYAKGPVLEGFNQPHFDASLSRQELDQIQSFQTGDPINSGLSLPGGAGDHFRLNDVARFADGVPEPQMNGSVQGIAPNPQFISPQSHELYQSVDPVFWPATIPPVQRSDHHSPSNSSPGQVQEEFLPENEINFGDYSVGEQTANKDSQLDPGVNPSSYQTPVPPPRDDEIVPNAGDNAYDFAPHLASKVVFEAGLEAVAETGAASDLAQSPEQLASPLQTASASNEVVLEFQTAQDLHDFKESRKTPQNHDSSLPTTWAAKSPRDIVAEAHSGISSTDYAIDDGAFSPLVPAARHTQLGVTSSSTQRSPFSTAEPRNESASASCLAHRLPAMHQRVLPRPAAPKTGVTNPLNGNGKRSADALPDRSPSPKHARNDRWHVEDATPTYKTNSASKTGRLMAPLLTSGRVLADPISRSDRGRNASQPTQHLQPGMPTSHSTPQSLHGQQSLNINSGATQVATPSTPVKRKRSAEADSESLGQVKRVQTRGSQILPPRDPSP